MVQIVLDKRMELHGNSAGDRGAMFLQQKMLELFQQQFKNKGNLK
jgi:hypothetical protein